jgi:hypothetical protein
MNLPMGQNLESIHLSLRLLLTSYVLQDTRHGPGSYMTTVRIGNSWNLNKKGIWNLGTQHLVSFGGSKVLSFWGEGTSSSNRVRIQVAVLILSYVSSKIMRVPRGMTSFFRCQQTPSHLPKVHIKIRESYDSLVTPR